MNESDSKNMSPEEKSEAIEQFCSFTGASEDRAKVTLEACNWNLELAVNMHVDGIDTGEPVDLLPTPEVSFSAGAASTVGASSSAAASAASATTTNEPGPASSAVVGESSSSEEVRPPIPPVRQVLVEDGFHGHRPRNPSQSVFDAFRNFRAEARWLEEGEGASSSSNLNKRRTLEELFRPPLELLYRGPMDQARDFAAQSNKWLMVNLQNVQEFACQVLNRDLWSNPAVKEIISEHFVFWQIYHDSYEGSKYMQFYNVMQFPYIAILDPRTGEKMRSWSNTIDPVTFCEVVTEFLMEHPSPNGALAPLERTSQPSTTREKNPYEETEEMQLRAAIAASLEDNHKAATDTPHDNNCKGDVDTDEGSELETFDSDEDVELSAKPSKESKKDVNSHSNEPPSGSKSGSGKMPASSPESWEKYLVPDNGRISDILIRFPDGTRDRQKFPADSPLKILFLYVASKGFSMDEYDLMICFPKKSLKEFSENDTLSSAGLYPANTVFVHIKS